MSVSFLYSRFDTQCDIILNPPPTLPPQQVAWATAATNYMALGHEQMAIRASDTAARLFPG